MLIRCKSVYRIVLGLGALTLGFGAQQLGFAKDPVCQPGFISGWFKNQTEGGSEASRGFFGLFSVRVGTGPALSGCDPSSGWLTYGISLLTGHFDSQPSCAQAEILNGFLSNGGNNPQFLEQTWSPPGTPWSTLVPPTDTWTKRLSDAAQLCETDFLKNVCRNGTVDLSSETTQSAIDTLYAPGAGQLLDQFCQSGKQAN
jgi:hypothetical protein